MKVSTIPYNFQSSNFDHVNKFYNNFNYTKNNLYKFPKDRTRAGTDGTVYVATNRAGSDIGVDGNIYSTDMNTGLTCTRLGSYEATGSVRVGPELEGNEQTMLKDIKIKDDTNLTSTWLSGVVGIMYKYSATGSHNDTNSGRVNNIGLCYLNPSNKKIVTYCAKHLITGLPYGSQPDDKDKIYSSAVMLDTGPKNTVIENNYKYIGLVLEHFHRHVSAPNITITCRFWNVRPIISYDKSAWNVTKDKLTVNGNASGKKIILPHPNTTWSKYDSGDYQIHTT